MYGSISAELEVDAPASLVWEVYRTLELSNIVEKQLTDVFDEIEVIEGDGSVGTILKLNFRPGVLAFPYCKEKFTRIDNEKRVKETELVEGGYLDFGFNHYSVRFDIVEKDEKSCITKTTLEYEIKEESVANASLVSIEPLKAIMHIAATHVLAKGH